MSTPFKPMKRSAHGEPCTMGQYFTQRLVQSGVSHVFTVPGDFTLLLLDEFLKEEKLSLIRCCNELNAGYAADGFTRATGAMSVVCVTYMVGSLSVINAIAGSYAEDLPVLIVVGGPNNLDRERCHLVHHTLGDTDFYKSAKCFEPVTAGTFSVRYITEAVRKIEESIKLCLTRKKPVYLELPCNLIQQHVSCWPKPVRMVPEIPILPTSDEVSLEAAMNAIRCHLDKAQKVVLVAGPKLRAMNAVDHFTKFACTMGCPVVVTPDAKGLFNEHDDCFLGFLWGSISNAVVQKAMDDADLVIYCGPIFNDYTTVGWTSIVNYEKSIIMSLDHVHVMFDRFSFICLNTVLARLADCAPKKSNFMVSELAEKEQFERGQHHSNDPLSLDFFQEEIQLAVGSGKYCAVVAETGDSWFIAEKLKIPPETQFHVQMQYGSIGWALGACMGVGLMSRQGGCGKVLALIGDGSFQVTAQELSTIISEQLDVTIMIINNASYTIEEQIHSGVYNQLVSWKYAQLVDVFRGEEPAARSYMVKSNGDLQQALRDSYEHHGVAVIECCMDMNDCTKEMRAWGEKIAAANRRAEA